MTQEQPDIVGHLQTAAHEVIAALRELLDVAEDVVSDPAQATSMFAAFGDMARGRRGDKHDDDDDDDGDDGGVQRIPVT
jgi:hypothetical protein